MERIPHRALMVDDQKVVLTGLSILVDAHPLLTVSNTANSAEEALTQLDPTLEIVVTDLNMTGLDGIALCRLIKEDRPELPVLLLSSADESLYAEQALDAGASGYLMKDDAPNELHRAILTVLEGRVFLTGAMWDRLLPPSHRAPGPLDVDESAMLEAIRLHRTVRGTAKALGIARGVLMSRQRDLLQRLGLSTPVQLRLLADWLADSPTA